MVIAQDIGVTGESHFRRQLDSFFWNYRFGVERNSEHYTLSFQNHFNSRLSLFEGEARNIQDENLAVFSFQRRILDDWSLLSEARSYRFSNTNVRQDFLMIGGQYRITPAANLGLLGGFIQDARSNEEDRGFMGGLRFESKDMVLGDINLSSNIHIDYADISPRSLQTFRWILFPSLDIDNFSMEGNVNLARTIRDSYQASSFFNRETSDFVESVRTDTTGIQLSLFFPLFEKLQSRLDIDYLNQVRRVTNLPLSDDIEQTLFDTRIMRQQFALRFQSVIPWGASRLIQGISFSVGGREAQLINTENLAEDQIRRRSEILLNSNFDQTRFEVFTMNTIRVGQFNESLLSGNISIMNYDTPAVNKDDRDELFFQLRVTNSHQFSEFFRTRLTLAGEATHTVYLFSERSIENNWRRSIRLIPEFEWSPMRWLDIRQQFLVRANYTVEDFELPGREKNDQVSREFATNTNLTIQLTQDWGLDVRASRSELRVGRLLWKEFREIPTDTLVTYDTRAMITHQAGMLHTSVGLRYFLKYDYLPRATIVANDINENGDPIIRSRTAPGRQTTVQWGPMVTMRLPLYNRNELFVNGWYQMQAVSQRLYTVYPEEFASIFRQAERSKSKRIYPNLEIIARFRL